MGKIDLNTMKSIKAEGISFWDRRSLKKAIHEISDIHVQIGSLLREFKLKAKEYVAGMSEKNVDRAATNIWPMLALQALNKKPLNISSSMAGYSMLYPLVDDVMDEPRYDDEYRKAFVRRFDEMISTGILEPKDDHEFNVKKMFQKIEEDWNRQNYPLIYRLMRELLQAELESRYQFGSPKHHKSVPDYEKVWEISVKKGGLSILCDAYLVSGRISDNEASFAFHFGAIAQWLNDLKDLEEDLKAGQYTPFNIITSQGKKLDGIYDYLMKYFRTVFEDSNHLRGSNGDFSKVSIKKRVFFRTMLSFLTNKFLEGVAINQDHFSQEFLAKVEAYSPISLKTLEKLYWTEKTKGGIEHRLAK